MIWERENRLDVMGSIIDSIPDIDSIAVRDGKTNAQITRLSYTDDTFDELADTYGFYYDLNWKENNLLNDNPFIRLDYMEGEHVRFTVSVFEVSESEKSLLPSDFTTEVGTVSYSYSPKKSDMTFVFAIEEISQLINVTEGFKELWNTGILKVPN